MGGTISNDTFNQVAFTVVGETWTIDPFVFVTVLSTRAVNSAVAQSTLINNGFVFSNANTGAGNDAAVQMSGTQASVTNGAGAVIKGSGPGTAGIRLTQGGVVDNHGTIIGTKDGIRIEGIDGTITNTGSIAGGVAGIEALSKLTLTNQGSVTGNVLITAAVGSSITNTGTITGDVTFTHGANLYDGRGGTITGAVHGGDGIDTLIGGKGADELFGGLAADTFEFIVKAEIGKGATADTIEDFSATDHDVIDLTALDASSTAKGNQVFHYIGSQNFHHKAGELNFKNHVLSGDTNGDGKADFQINVLNIDTLTKGIDIHL